MLTVSAKRRAEVHLITTLQNTDRIDRKAAKAPICMGYVRSIPTTVTVRKSVVIDRKHKYGLSQVL